VPDAELALVHTQNVARETLDSLANGYWTLSRIYLQRAFQGLGRPEPTDDDQWKHIDRDPFWQQACAALEPGMLAGETTSLTVSIGIDRLKKLDPRGRWPATTQDEPSQKKGPPDA
jgi:hypothetical protein